MTTEVFTPAAQYTIAGTGPYTVPHPYNWRNDLVVDVLYQGAMYRQVRGTHYSVSPDSSETTGSITLSSGRAEAYAGGTLIITRSTVIEQGWAGMAGPREKGLERQLDRLARAVQDNRAQADRYKAAFDALAAQIADLTSDVFVPVNTITVGVGTTGDYPDLPTADFALRRHAAAGARINLHIVSPLTRGWGIADRNCQSYHIHSDIGVVPLDAGFEGVDAVNLFGDTFFTNMHVLVGYNAVLPTLRCVIDMGGEHGDGYVAHGNASGRVLPNGGVINAGGYGARAMYQSRLSLRLTDFSGAAQSGVRLDYASVAEVNAADLSGCCTDFNEERSRQGALDVANGSTASAYAADLTGSGASGINCRDGSTVEFQLADCSGAAYNGAVFFNASTGAGKGAICNGATGAVDEVNTGIGVRATSGSIVHFGEGESKNNDAEDLFVNGGAQIIANLVETTNSVSGDGPPIIGDTNHSAFNTWSEKGSIILVTP